MSLVAKLAVSFAVGSVVFFSVLQFDWRVPRGWWSDRRLLWKARAHQRRQDRAWRRIAADSRRRARALVEAQAPFARNYLEAEQRERQAAIWLGVLAGIVLAIVAGLILAGCDGIYPMAPSPDAGADAGLPPCMAPAGSVIIAHGCDCASDPLADACSTETTDGFGPAPLVACQLQNGEHCIADCRSCARDMGGEL